MSEFERQFFNSSHVSGRFPKVWGLDYNGRYYLPHVMHAQTGHCNFPSSKRRRSHVHPVYHLVIITRGRGNFVVDGQLQRTEKGKLFIVDPNVQHCFMNALGETTEYSELTFEFRTTDGEPLNIPFSKCVEAWLNRPCPPFVSSIIPDDDASCLYERLRKIVNMGLDREIDTDLYLNIELFSMMLGLYEKILCGENTSNISPVERARAYIQRNYAMNITLTELADVAHLSPNYLSRYFKQCFGLTPIAYQIQMRIQAACTILQTTDDTIKYVSQRTGFRDHYYFSRLFRRNMGCSPSAYRRKEKHHSGKSY